MKRELDEDINWGRLFLKVILIFVAIILIIWFISKFFLKRDNVSSAQQFENNLNKMYDVALKYFEEGNKLPKNGEHATLTLKEMIDKELIGKLKYDDVTCSSKSSYAKVSNKDGKYTLKVLLTCGSESDYISKVIKVEEKEDTKNDGSSANNSEQTANNNSNVTTNSSSNVTSTTNNANVNENNGTSQDKGQVIVTDYTKMKYKFCKIENSEYYTVVYLNSNDIKKDYQTSYTIKLNDLGNIDKITVSDDNYFMSKNYYKRYKNNLENNFTVIDGKSAKGIANISKKFAKASLKSSDFSYKLTNVYEKDGNYYIDVEITIKKSSRYTDTYNSNKINYVPIYFNVSYADLDNCVTDTYTNSSKYKYYYVIN